jgi:hypothetical protein
MSKVDRKGNLKRGRYVRPTRKLPSNADECFRKGVKFFDGNFLDNALLCFIEAKRLRHKSAEHAIEICKNHGADYPLARPVQKRRQRIKMHPEPMPRQQVVNVTENTQRV